jgi:hypothetical protein
MSSDSESVSVATSSSDESTISETSTASSLSETTQEFRIKLITYMNMKLAHECDIDDLESQGESDNTTTATTTNRDGQEYKVGEYNIIHIRDNICFIWADNSYFLVNLDTEVAHMRLFSSKTEGKLVKAVLGNQELDYITSPKIRLLFEGQPEKTQADVPRGRYNILAEPYYTHQDYNLDLSGMCNMTYCPSSNQVYSYPNGRMPEIS